MTVSSLHCFRFSTQSFVRTLVVLLAPLFIWNTLNWVCSNQTSWEAGVYPVTLRFPEEYPSAPPHVSFPAGFFHPNVFHNGAVCLSILNEEKDWRPSITVKQVRPLSWRCPSSQTALLLAGGVPSLPLLLVRRSGGQATFFFCRRCALFPLIFYYFSCPWYSFVCFMLNVTHIFGRFCWDCRICCLIRTQRTLLRYSFLCAAISRCLLNPSADWCPGGLYAQSAGVRRTHTETGTDFLSCFPHGAAASSPSQAQAHDSLLY
jgi:hypothetical protein